MLNTNVFVAKVGGWSGLGVTCCFYEVQSCRPMEKYKNHGFMLGFPIPFCFSGGKKMESVF